MHPYNKGLFKTKGMLFSILITLIWESFIFIWEKVGLKLETYDCPSISSFGTYNGFEILESKLILCETVFLGAKGDGEETKGIDDVESLGFVNCISIDPFVNFVILEIIFW